MKLTHVLYLLTLLLLTGCFKKDEPVIYEDVEGVVLSSNGDPINNAHVHIRNHFSPGGYDIEGTGASVAIPFNVSFKSVYEAVLFNHGADTLIATFFKDTLSAGQHSIIIPDSLLSNGVYGYEIRSERGPLFANLFLVNKPDSLLPASRPFTTTNIRGEFTLNSLYLALGRSFGSSSGGRFEITDSLQIIVTDTSQVLKKREIEIKPDQPNFFEITLD